MGLYTFCKPKPNLFNSIRKAKYTPKAIYCIDFGPSVKGFAQISIAELQRHVQSDTAIDHIAIARMRAQTSSSSRLCTVGSSFSMIIK